MSKSKWKLIGHAGVDSGLLSLVDPCYALPKDDEKYNKDNLTYEKMLDKIEDMPPKNAKEIIFSGTGGNGMVFNTTYGDGDYPVYGRFETEVFNGKEVEILTAVKVEMG